MPAEKHYLRQALLPFIYLYYRGNFKIDIYDFVIVLNILSSVFKHNFFIILNDLPNRYYTIRAKLILNH